VPTGLACAARSATVPARPCAYSTNGKGPLPSGLKTFVTISIALPSIVTGTRKVSPC
jgi:hypothetical protein